ncbi:MAG: Pycsar system effector family protein [Bacillota bacterium]
MDIDKLHKQLDKNDQWIQNADMKLSIILAFLGVLGGIILSEGKVFELLKDGLTTIEGAAFSAFSLAFILLGFGITYAIRGITATLKNPRKSLWFFGDVGRYSDWSHYKRRKERETNEEAIDDLLSQIHITSKVAVNKFRWLNLSIKVSTWSLGFFAAYFILMNISSVVN